MTLEHLPILDLPACQMDSDALDTLSYIFCENKPFTRFVELYTWFMAELPSENRVKEFWEEVEDLGWSI